jgi:hypothetical protein
MGLASAGGVTQSPAMAAETRQPRLRIRIVFGDAEMIGPGKANCWSGSAAAGRSPPPGARWG